MINFKLLKPRSLSKLIPKSLIELALRTIIYYILFQKRISALRVKEITLNLSIFRGK